MIVSHHYPINPIASLLVILGIISVGVIASITSGNKDSIPLKSPVESDLDKLSKVTVKTIRKILILVIGSTLLLLGTVMILTPGPGIPVLIVGLIVLATEFVWAKVWLAKVKSGLKEGEAKARKIFHMEEDSDKGK